MELNQKSGDGLDGRLFRSRLNTPSLPQPFIKFLPCDPLHRVRPEGVPGTFWPPGFLRGHPSAPDLCSKTPLCIILHTYHILSGTTAILLAFVFCETFLLHIFYYLCSFSHGLFTILMLSMASSLPWLLGCVFRDVLWSAGPSWVPARQVCQDAPPHPVSTRSLSLLCFRGD